MKIKESKLNYISLFTGAGGFDIGFDEVGFECLLASDIMEHAARTYSLNRPNVPFINKDIKKIGIHEIKKYVGNQNVDVIIGGPPCQGFSNMGNKNSADPRNYLFESYVSIVSNLRPKIFIFENVKGLFTMFEGRFFENVVNSFLRIGYNISYSVIDSSIYGVPQKRERIILVGTLSKEPFIFPPTNNNNIGNLKSYLNVGEAINDLIDKDEKVANHIPLSHSDIVIKRYKLIPEGGKLPKPSDLPIEIRRKNFGNTYTRLHRLKISSTIVPGNNALPVHPILDRSLTPREAARIQTFPDEYIFLGDRRSQCILVGNAVPPLMAANIAQCVELYLRNDKYQGIAPDGFIAHENGKYKMTRKGSNFSAKRATFKFADLFCGVGGFTQGLEQAGLKCVLGVDFDEHAVNAYKSNHTGHESLLADLSSKSVQNQVAKKIKDSGAELIVGGPPCQGFSIFGNRRFVNTKNHNLAEDKRNDLVFAFANIVIKSDVKWFIMENVPGIVSARSGKYINQIVDYFHANGFKTEYRIINAADYGAPQLRKRFILIGTKTDLIIPFPKPKYFLNPESWQSSYRTVGEAISDLAEPSSLGQHKNHVAPKHSVIVAERLSYIKEGEKLDISLLPKKLKIGTKTGKPISNYSHIYKRLDRNKPSGTIVPGHNALPVHPTLNRTLTIREAARIQTFPDSYEFTGPIINQSLQVGNAFPCIVAQTFGERLRTVINKNWRIDNTTDLAKYSMLEE
jgi:DNA (cytosine-5)-methyltransferase 1